MGMKRQENGLTYLQNRIVELSEYEDDGEKMMTMMSEIEERRRRSEDMKRTLVC